MREDGVFFLEIFYFMFICAKHAMCVVKKVLFAKMSMIFLKRS